MAINSREFYDSWKEVNQGVVLVGEDQTLLSNDIDRSLMNTTYGPLDLANSSGDLIARVWSVVLDGITATLQIGNVDSSEWETTHHLFDLPNAEASFPSLAFDQLGKPLVTYMHNGHGWLYWYNPVTAANEIRDLGVMTTLTILLDYPFSSSTVVSDVVIFYCDANYNLKYLLQKDRYAVPYDAALVLQDAVLFGGGLQEDNTVKLIYGKARA